MELLWDPLDKVAINRVLQLLELVDGIEIQLEPHYLSIDKARAVLRDFPDDKKLILHAPYRDTNLLSPLPEIREASFKVVERTLELASEINAQTVVVHPGQTLGTLALGSVWEELAKLSEEHSVPVCLENEPPHNLFIRPTHPSDFPPGAKICLDVAHSELSGSFDAFVDLRKSDIVLVHISDTVPLKDLHLPPGEGSLPWGKILKELPRDVPWVLEVGSEDGLKKGITYLQEKLEWLS